MKAVRAGTSGLRRWAERPWIRVDSGRTVERTGAEKMMELYRNESLAGRVSDADLAYLAMDRGPVHEQFAVVLLLGPGFDVERGARVLGERVRQIPRLRQRIVRTRRGPAWADDCSFDPARHIYTRRCRRPCNERSVLEVVVPEVTWWLRRDRPLWRAIFVTGLAEGRTALVLIVHHALADGLGGLAVLNALMDGGGSPSGPGAGPPERRRRRGPIAASTDLFHGRAARNSLLRPTGSRRRALAVRTGLEPVRAAAHQAGATVNAAVLVAVAGALRRLLAYRRESLDAVRVGVPVGDSHHSAPGAGNAVSLMVVTVPADGPYRPRMARVAADTRARRGRAAAPAPITVLGRVFRLAAATGSYQWYMNHQRRLHIVISCLRGPAGPVCLAGVPVERMIPIAPATTSNLTMACQALSYAGELTVTTVADPGRCPELDLFGRYLHAELEAVATRR
ncbi:wax ester/triacylglycerol synthase domain-containing protein [Actinoplanes sp. NPDC049596]|uniref:wax ester/triacylglycerol synthase domain-containing protein n=1 Tax=unclassified Actinoplanes TaxID=2626549 RepID=UPI003442C8F7